MAEPTPLASRPHPAERPYPGGVARARVMSAAHPVPRSTYVPEGACVHTLGSVLKMNSTEVSSLYIGGIAIIHFLLCCKHFSHVRHVEKPKSGPKCS